MGDDPLSEEDHGADRNQKSPADPAAWPVVALDTNFNCAAGWILDKPTGTRLFPRISRAGRQPPRRRGHRSRSPPYAPTAGSGTQLAGAAAALAATVGPPTDSPATRPSGAVWRGWRFISGLGSCLTTWGLGKTVQLLALETLESFQRHQDAASVTLLCDIVVGGQLAAGSGRVLRPTCRCTPPAPGCLAEALRTTTSSAPKPGH